MKIEEIIEFLNMMAYGAEDAANDKDFSKSARKRHKRSADMIREAISLLKTHTDAQKNEPLTAEELRGMEGEIVFCTPLNDFAKVTKFGLLFFGDSECRGWNNLLKNYGVWLAYLPPDIMEELKAYRATGFEPQDIKKTFNDNVLLKLASRIFGWTPDHLRELARAEKDGRLVVLPFSGYSISGKALQQLAKADHEGRLIVPPCKIGDLLYEIDLPEYGVITCKVVSISYYDGPMFHVPGNEEVSSLTVEVEVIEGHGKGSSYNFEIEDFGKTVFLTRQEAEEALSNG